MTPATRQIVFINTAHGFTHYCLLILPTAVLAMAVPGGGFGADYGADPRARHRRFVLYGLFSLPQGWLAQRLGRQGADGGLLPRHRRLPGRRRASPPSPWMLAPALAGGRAVRRHLPPGRHRHAGRGRRRQARPGDRLNGVFGNLGVALAPVVTAFLAAQFGWRCGLRRARLLCAALGLLWLRTPLPSTATRRAGARPFPPIPPHLVRRAVVVLLLIAAVSGLVFNAFTLLLPKLMQERLAGDPVAAAAGRHRRHRRHAVRRADAVHGRPDDRPHHAEAGVPAAGVVLAPALAALAFAQGWLVLPLAGAGRRRRCSAR